MIRFLSRFIILSLLLAGVGYASGFDAPPTDGADFVYPLSSSAVVIIRTNDRAFDEETYLKGDDERWHLYRSQRGLCGSCPEGYFIKTTKEDSLGNVLSVNEELYDHDDNLLCETITGNLCGKGIKESYCHRYNYDSRGLLIDTTEDNGFTLHHRYNDNGKATAKLLIDGDAIVGRLFMRYDDQGRLTRLTIDDGDQEEANNLSGISCRKITTVSFIDGEVVTEEGYLDLSTGDEVLVKKTVESFDECGDLYQHIAYDSLGDYWFSRYIDRDKQAQTVSILDSTGLATSYEFDEMGGLTLSGGSQQKNKFYTPEETFSDNIIVGDNGRALRYDERGNVVTTADDAGNETNFSYDAFNRLISITYPAVLNNDDHSFNPQVARLYDVNDNIVKITDADGGKTCVQYNIRDKKTNVTRPDGTTEKFIYNNDGSLASTILSSGVTIHYQYDYLSRVTTKELFAADGTPLKSEKFTYSLFGMTSHTDTRGIITHFDYDGAGRLTGASRDVDGKTLKVKLYYDTRGNLAKKEETFGENTDDQAVTVYHRGDDDNLVATTVETADGQPQLHHDIAPPKSNGDQEPYYVLNDREQKVKQTITADEAGVITATTFDAMERPEKIEKHTADGTLVAYQLLRYDGVGRKTMEADAYIENGTISSFVKTFWLYGKGGRLETLIEDVDTACTSETHYHYDNCGRLATIVKPDNVKIEHRYDSASRLSLKYASDESFAYQYSYDNDNNLTDIVDLIHGTATHREYTRSGHLAHEKLGNDLSLHSEYDGKGRRSRLELTDGSAISYCYKGALLKKIERFSSEGCQQYCHQYDSFDLGGRLRSAKMIGNLGTTAYRWHSQLKKISAVTTLFWAEEIPEAAFDANGNITQIETADILGGTSCHYAYDDCQRITYEYGVEEHNYRYDSLENRVAVDDALCGVCGRSRLVQQGDDRFHYDVNGNLIKKIHNSATTLYSYDALNRLTQVVKELDYKLNYSYDAFDRRLTEKRYRWDDINATWMPISDLCFLYDGDDEIGVVDNEGTVRKLRVLGLGHGAEIGASIAVEVTDEGSTQRYAPIHNGRGSVTCLVDIEEGKPVELYRYTSFGSEQLFDSEGKPIDDSAIGNPWRFSSKHVDELSGLVYFGKRYYDPSIGRWTTKDPMGYFDGANLYAYVHNNPLNNLDHYGLWSVGSFFQDVGEAWNAAVNAVGEVVDQTYEYLCDQLEVLEDLQQTGSEAVKKAVGEVVYFLMGNNAEPDLTNSYGKGEVSPKVRVTYLNGLLSPFEYHIEQMDHLSKAHGNTNIHYIYRGTRGWTWDMTQAMLIKVGGYVSPYAKMLSIKWKALIAEMGGPGNGGTIYHYTHSMGGSDTHNALNLMTPEEQQMIRVYAFGPSKYVTANNCAYAINYISSRDGVGLFDPVGYYRSKMASYNCNIQIIGGFWDGLPFPEHLFCCDTYREVWEQLGKEFVDSYGVVK